MSQHLYPFSLPVPLPAAATPVPGDAQGGSVPGLPPPLVALRDRLRRECAGTAAGVHRLGDARMARCLPEGGLPLGQAHEVEADGVEAETAGLGAAFAATVLADVAPQLAVVWVSRQDDLYPPGLTAFGFDPARLLMVRPVDETGVLAAMEAALREGGLAAVVGEVGRLGRVGSRRLHFACQRRGVTALVLRRFPYGRGTSAAQQEATLVSTRWRIAVLPSERTGREPGVPRWRLELAHARAGRPGAWAVEPARYRAREQSDTHDANRDDCGTAPIRPAYPFRVVAELADHPATASHRRRAHG